MRDSAVDVSDRPVGCLEHPRLDRASSKPASSQSQKSISSETRKPKVRSRPPWNPSTEIRSPSISTQPLQVPGSLMWYMSASSLPSLPRTLIGSNSHIGALGS